MFSSLYLNLRLWLTTVLRERQETETMRELEVIRDCESIIEDWSMLLSSSITISNFGRCLRRMRLRGVSLYSIR